jgi:LmbE family N-acetylglucosaminyl deacetylase
MNILAIGAHPDDLEIGCGGTLAKYASRGDKVFMCHVSTGNVGHRIIMPDELMKIRAEEARKAGELIGAEVIGLGERDLFVRSDNMETRDKIVDIIRYTKPDIIITHNPSDYMDDHEETSRLVYEASMAATVNHHHTRYEFYPKLTPIYYMEPLCGVNSLPQEYVDITDFIDIKLKMMACHESQVKWLMDHDNLDFLDLARTMAKFRGYQCDTGYAEGFTYCKAYHKLSTKRLLP